MTCAIKAMTGNSGAELEANAHLIAAAPDLLSVLEKIWRLQHDGCTDDEWSAAWSEAEAVMDKARGQA